MASASNFDPAEGLRALRSAIERLTRKPVVLIVDDHKWERDLLAKELQAMCPCEISQAEQGEYAVTILAAQDVDVIFLDLVLPGMSGLDVMAQMSEAEKKKTIILTCLDEEAEQIKEAIRLGAVKVITKPVKAEDLKALFSRQL